MLLHEFPKCGKESLVDDYDKCCQKVEEDEDRWQLSQSSSMQFLSDSQKGSLCGMCRFEARLSGILEALGSL